jgi:hypothetical protein
MNAIVKMFRSFRVSGPADTAFENYYGALVRGHSVGGPSAAEARRDFRAVRQVMDRVNFY